jgi:hypothetical protein
MSAHQPITFSPSMKDTDIADEIAERALDHVPHSYFDQLLTMQESGRTVALQDFVQSVRYLLRDFTVCHDLALSQLVRAHKSSDATQKMLLAGGLENLLGLANTNQASLDDCFRTLMLGQYQTKAVHALGMPEPGVNSLRNRMINLAGSERAGVGLGAVAAIYELCKAGLPYAGRIAHKPKDYVDAMRGPIAPYDVLLREALRDVAQGASARRAVAFGATQAFQLSDDLFAFLKSRTERSN